jgi:hypothetical protein
VDFLRGKEAYKAIWAPTEEAVNCRLVLLRRRSARAHTMLWLDDLPARMTSLIKAKKRLVQVLHLVKDAVIPVGQKGTGDPARVG